MAEQSVFVGREPELAQLDGLLNKALAGQGQICFVLGEAGAGKTALAGEFARRAQERHADLVVALGSCDAQTGVGDAYLPFREVLDLLTGNVNAKLAQGRITHENAKRLRNLLILSGETLVEIGPDLIGLLVPGGKLLAEAGKFLVEKSEWADKIKQRMDRKRVAEALGKEGLDQSQIFEQYINVLQALARNTPLVLVLEDLQWADPASLGLLFRLGRRLEGGRLLVIGTYRPNDVSLGRDGQRHPLEPVVSEMKRYLGDIEVDLDRATALRGRAFVDAYLDTQLNCLDESFREALFQQTGGHPLFTVELLRHMRERNDLVQDADGCWREGPDLDWTDLPSRVEGVIEERVARLTGDLRQCLTVGSVEGKLFTAEVVAQIEAVEVRGLVRELSGEVQKEHRLVESQGVERLGQQRLSHYRFSHKLIQSYLYAGLDEVQLSYLHEDVGNALETFYGELAGEIAVQLARHFERAEVPDKARRYLRKAGEQAAAAFANAEAVSYFSRALALTPPTEAEARYGLLRARERVYDLLGEREAQDRDLAEMQQLAAHLANLGYQAEAALRRAAYDLQTGRYEEAAAAAEESATLAVQTGDPLAEAWAHHRWSRAFWQAGEYAPARPHLKKALDLARAQQSPIDEARCLYDLGVVDYYLDRYEEALATLQQASDLYNQLQNQQGTIRCLSMVGLILDRLGRPVEAGQRMERTLQLCREVGWRYAQSRILAQRGNNLIDLGDLEAGRQRHEEAISLYQDIGDQEGEAVSLDTLGLIAVSQNRPDEARRYHKQALNIQRSLQNQRSVGYALTHLGYALVELDEWQAAQHALEEALALRREAGGEGLIMDTLAGLALVKLHTEDSEQALTTVDEIVSWLDAHGPAGVEFPVLVYLIAHRVLAALAAARPDLEAKARQVLEAGHALLMERADRIDDEALRQQFLEAIPFNRKIQARWQAAR